MQWVCCEQADNIGREERAELVRQRAAGSTCTIAVMSGWGGARYRADPALQGTRSVRVLLGWRAAILLGQLLLEAYAVGSGPGVGASIRP